MKNKGYSFYWPSLYIHIYTHTYTSKQNIRESAQFNITTVNSKVIRQGAARVWPERVSAGTGGV